MAAEVKAHTRAVLLADNTTGVAGPFAIHTIVFVNITGSALNAMIQTYEDGAATGEIIFHSFPPSDGVSVVTFNEPVDVPGVQGQAGLTANNRALLFYD